MTWCVTDSLLYITIIASAFYAYHTIPDTLNHIRNLAACPEQTGPGPRKQLQKDAENAIGIDTLRVLSEGPSYDLRASTIKIVAVRTVNSRTKKLLLKDLASKNEEKRQNAIYAFSMLLSHPTLSKKRFVHNLVDYRSYHAVITALKNVIADHDTSLSTIDPQTANPLYPEPRIPPSPIRPPNRPSHELLLMKILRILLTNERMTETFEENINRALSAGLVTRWLKHYPFPCSLPQNSKYNYKKSDVCMLVRQRGWEEDDPLMAAIINYIIVSPLGGKHLRDAGLSGPTHDELEEVENALSRWRHYPATLDSDNDVRMINGESTAGAATPPPIPLDRQRRPNNTDPPRARSRELSPEEENLRRRRRQAMVLADADVPLSQDHILQRTDSGNAWRITPYPGPSTTQPAVDISSTTIPELSPALQETFTTLLGPILERQNEWIELRDADDDPLEDEDPAYVLQQLSSLVYRVNSHRDSVSVEIGRLGITSTERELMQRRLDQIVLEITEGEDLLRLTDLLGRRTYEESELRRRGGWS